MGRLARDAGLLNGRLGQAVALVVICGCAVFVVLHPPARPSRSGPSVVHRFHGGTLPYQRRWAARSE